jgi:hypothetical protein
MTEALAEKTCAPCRGGIPPLTRDEAQRLQAQARDWQLADDAHRIERTFRFRYFRGIAGFCSGSRRARRDRRMVADMRTLESPAPWPKCHALSPAGRISLRTPQMDGKSPWTRTRAV